MLNFGLGFLFIIVNFILVLLAYRFFGKVGLFVWIAISTILANIQVVKTIEVFSITATLGNTLYGSIFLATDILNENHIEKDAKKSVWLGFFSAIVMIITMQLAILFIPAASDYSQASLVTIFNPTIRIVVGSLVAYLISQFLDVKVFQKIRKRFPSDKMLWLRNNGSTWFSQLIDTLIFVSIAFVGQFELPILVEIYVTTYLFKIIVALIDTPFMYLSKIIAKKIQKD